MPWEDLDQMTDGELEAIFQYRESLPALEDAIQ